MYTANSTSLWLHASAHSLAGAMTNGNSTSATRRQLSFSIASTSTAAPPRSNLGMMVSSIRSSLNAVLSQRAVLEA